jgi:hypothetical protein
MALFGRLEYECKNKLVMELAERERLFFTASRILRVWGEVSDRPATAPSTYLPEVGASVILNLPQGNSMECLVFKLPSDNVECLYLS